MVLCYVYLYCVGLQRNKRWESAFVRERHSGRCQGGGVTVVGSKRRENLFYGKSVLGSTIARVQNVFDDPNLNSFF